MLKNIPRKKNEVCNCFQTLNLHPNKRNYKNIKKKHLTSKYKYKYKRIGKKTLYQMLQQLTKVQ